MSIISICLETVIESNIKQKMIKINKEKNSDRRVDIFISFSNLLSNENDTRSNETYLGTTERKNEFFITEFVCNSIFTIEILMRILVSKRKLIFFKSIINIIDVIAILPFWISIILFYINSNDKINYFGLSFLKVLRLTRILRVFKLSRHIRVLNIMVHSITQCVHEITLLVTILAINVVIFSSFMYHIEQQIKGKESQFLSIPHSFWWAIISFTTVGYGILLYLKL